VFDWTPRDGCRMQCHRSGDRTKQSLLTISKGSAWIAVRFKPSYPHPQLVGEEEEEERLHLRSKTQRKCVQTLEVVVAGRLAP